MVLRKGRRYKGKSGFLSASQLTNLERIVMGTNAAGRRRRATVVHVTTERGWRGGERQIDLLVSGLYEDNLTQVIAAPKGSPLALRLRGAGFSVLSLHPKEPLHPVNWLRLWSLARRSPEVLFHSHSSHALSLAALTKRATNACGIVHTRGVAYPVRPSWKYRTAADRYVGVSNAVAGLMVAAGMPRERTTVIRCAVDIEAADAVPPREEMRSKDLAVGCVAALSPEKGHSTLLEAWKTVRQQRPDASLVLIGDGPLRKSIESSAADLGPGAVRLTGIRDDVPALLKQLDLYVQPSLEEGLGIAALEAMACGLPVVASRVGGLPEIVKDNTTGVLVEPDNPSHLARVILGLLAEPERRKRLGVTAREHVAEHHTVGGMVASYQSVYESVAL
jgi:glycosyltransferase involved in cell wall biosynthesis